MHRRARPEPLLCRAGLLRAALAASLAAPVVISISGCSSLSNEGAATAAGIGGTAIAAKVTRNAAVASGIGLGVLAAAESGVKTLERNYHGDQQDQIAHVAGALSVGAVGYWKSVHSVQLEPNATGRVTVSRVIGATGLTCKEIVFSVDETKKGTAETISAFYVATICKDASRWKWASAEPATPRWGSLQ